MLIISYITGLLIIIYITGLLIIRYITGLLIIRYITGLIIRYITGLSNYSVILRPAPRLLPTATMFSPSKQTYN